MTPPRRLSRRHFLGLMTMGAGATALVACTTRQEVPSPAGSTVPPPASSPTPPPVPTTEPTAVPTSVPERTPAVRFAHISDMHIQPGGSILEHFSRAMRDVQVRAPAVEFVINAGDCVMDSMWSDQPKAESQWDAFQKILSPDFPLTVHHILGNHDVWGWGLSDTEQAALKDNPLFGKGLALKRLGLASPYYTFDYGGWRFILLDSVHPADQAFDQPYTGKLDDEQYNWLVQTLDGTPAEQPVCIVSHIPIFGACGLMDSSESTGNWVMPGAWQHIDGRKLIDLFWQHPNVKLCLSGHTHQLEKLNYHGVDYLTNGAISGNWWGGAFHDFPPGYVVFNLYADGSFESEFVAY